MKTLESLLSCPEEEEVASAKRVEETGLNKTIWRRPRPILPVWKQICAGSLAMRDLSVSRKFQYPNDYLNKTIGILR